MYSSVIGKIEKAKRYAEERERLHLSQFTAQFQGEHSTYALSYEDGSWQCACPFFANHDVCSHSMAAQRMLEGMLAQSAPTP